MRSSTRLANSDFFSHRDRGYTLERSHD